MESSSPFQTLPVELIYRMLDLLDAKDILFSFGHVCRRFYTIARNYNRLSIKFTYDSPIADIRRLCRVIKPENIVVLSLKNSLYQSKNNVIQLFLRCTFICQMTRLRSLMIGDVEEYDLQTIMHVLITTSTLTSLSLKMNKIKILTNDSIVLLSAMVAIPSLRKLTLVVDRKIIDQILWPNPCTIQELRIRTCTDENLFNILHQLPNLRIFGMNEFNIQSINQIVQRTSYYQLTSFSFNYISISIDKIEFLLSFFPSLIYLKLTTKATQSYDFGKRFSQWEQEHFIGKKLPLLQKFDFDISFMCDNNLNLESVLTPFCTSFWLEEKHWFVTAIYRHDNWGSILTLQSSIFSTEIFPNKLSSSAIAYSATTIRSDNALKRSNDWNLRINLSWISMVNIKCLL
ncbi:unnamed protein product [Adineta steineri]|uniref:F-box domain-containing protein n=1 Tax=Adineta steineri TaxID=433720 RepID=A0A814EV68_9BILA|nr:unnamed protein product [Adineta steineri]CAF4158249.1 unnamed protein product [Adineta steineri]